MKAFKEKIFENIFQFTFKIKQAKLSQVNLNEISQISFFLDQISFLLDFTVYETKKLHFKFVLYSNISRIAK